LGRRLPFWRSDPVTQEYGKIGKSLKNVISPDEVREQYGCDTLRLYEMYMGPLDASKPWAPRKVLCRVFLSPSVPVSQLPPEAGTRYRRAHRP
jgi:hypothetical protein